MILCLILEGKAKRKQNKLLRRLKVIKKFRNLHFSLTCLCRGTKMEGGNLTSIILSLIDKMGAYRSPLFVHLINSKCDLL